MRVIAKRESIFESIFGFTVFLAGLNLYNRANEGNDENFLSETMLKLKNKNANVWVLPEGTRRNTGEIHEFKKGAFHAAIHAQVPIVPVVFSSYKQFLDQKKKVFDKGEIIITALPEISTKGLMSKDVDGLIERTRHQMIETYNKSSKEVQMKMLKYF
jgi:lysophosphatidate acyltransferase